MASFVAMLRKRKVSWRKGAAATRCLKAGRAEINSEPGFENRVGARFAAPVSGGSDSFRSQGEGAAS